MKKIGTFINVFVIIILLLLLVILFGPMLLPNNTIDLLEKRVDTSTPYQTDLVMTLSSKDSDLMDDIYLENTFKINNEYHEIYNFMELNLGGETFEWKRLFDNNKLQERNPFDGRSIEFSDINNYDIARIETEDLPFLYRFSDSNRKNMNIVHKIYGLDPHETAGFGNKLRMYYTYEADANSATNIFKDFLLYLQSSNGYKSFFNESKQVEQKLSMEDGVSELNNIVNMLIDNVSVDKLTIKYSVSMFGVEHIEMDVDFKYNIDNQTISMNFYTSQNFENIEADKVAEDVYFTSLTNIRDLAPDIREETNESDVGMINNPMEDGTIPGLILSDEYKNGRGG